MDKTKWIRLIQWKFGGMGNFHENSKPCSKDSLHLLPPDLIKDSDRNRVLKSVQRADIQWPNIPEESKSTATLDHNKHNSFD
jgi:hypothetical protein